MYNFQDCGRIAEENLLRILFIDRSVSSSSLCAAPYRRSMPLRRRTGRAASRALPCSIDIRRQGSARECAGAHSLRFMSRFYELLSIFFRERILSSIRKATSSFSIIGSSIILSGVMIVTMFVFVSNPAP